MRALFASTRGAGHYFPLVPFMQALRRGGHEVIVAGPAELAPAVAADGFDLWELGDPPDEAIQAVWSRVRQTESYEEGERLVVGEMFGRLRTTATLPRLLEAMDQWKPDVVLREISQFASALAAERHGVPHARIGFGISAAEHYGLMLADKAVNDVRAEAGLDPDPGLESLRRSPYLTCTPASLEDPELPLMPHTVRFRDPAWDAAAEPLPGWWPGDDGRPLVYITFGSVAGGEERFRTAFGAAAEAVADLPVRALMTVGREMDPDALRPRPANLHVEPWVRQADALAHATAVIHHGGSGSTTGALAAGKPSVVVPMFADQPLNAAAVERAGAGLVVAPASPQDIEGALAALLADDAYTRAARRVGEEMRAHPPVDAVADHL
ncbi:MAG TPA: glycosyltransferase [Solirubrobacteraceae bacterium]|jgi:UDP:flavonoid glycosyltransferase YjiC (YdhE family)